MGDDAVFCENCGTAIKRAANPAPGSNLPAQQANTNKQKIWERRVALTGKTKGIAGLGVAAALLLLFFAVSGKGPESIALDKTEETVKIGETVELSFTIDPSDAKNRKVSWSSSDETIATVKGGVVSGISEGECIITVKTRNGKTDTCTLTVSTGPDLKKIHDMYCGKMSELFARISKDGSYLFIDTNPLNSDNFFSQESKEAMDAIYQVNEALDLPETVQEEMWQTTAADGLQSYSMEGLDVTWTYHPNHGLEVNYSIT